MGFKSENRLYFKVLTKIVQISCLVGYAVFMEIIGNQTIFLSLLIGIYGSFYGMAQFQELPWRKRGLFYSVSHGAALVFLGIGIAFWFSPNLKLKPFGFGALGVALVSYFLFYELHKAKTAADIPARKLSAFYKIPVLVGAIILFYYQQLGHLKMGFFFLVLLAVGLFKIYQDRQQYRLVFRFTFFAAICLILSFLIFLIPYRYLWIEILESVFFTIGLWYFYQGLNFMMVRIYTLERLKETS